MPKNKKIKFFLFFLLLFLLLGANFVFTLPAFASPQKLGGLALEINYPNLPGMSPPTNNSSLPDYIKYIFNLALWAGGLLALGSLIYGGIRYLISSGKPETIISARNQINAAFFGLLILLSSYLVLKTINPQFVNLKIPLLNPIETVQKKQVSVPTVGLLKSSIETEMPFGRIIEKIFEIYISDFPEPENKKTPRITRIKNNVITTKELTDNLLSQSEDLKTAAHKCTCHSTDPVPRCGSRSGCGGPDTEWKCGCGGCSSREECTCDPCEKVRGDIQSTEQKNLENIYLGTNMSQTDESGKKTTITTSLIGEMQKTITEVKDLKIELDRLKRAEKFIKECSFRTLTSLAQFFSKKDVYNIQNVIVRKIKFWDDINIVYNKIYTNYTAYGNYSYEKSINDFSTFYCADSGTVEQEYPFPEPTQSSLAGHEDIENADDVFSSSMACSEEAPVGEIIDRTERTTKLLIDKSEKLIGLDKKMVDAVDDLQVLISQCSSKRGCERRCWCQSCPCTSEGECEPTCCGYIYCCADSSEGHQCLEKDEDNTPCR